MARLAPIETHKRGSPAPVWISGSKLTDVARLTQAYMTQRRPRILLACVSVQTLLLLISLTPQTTWASLHLPNGPIPPLLTPLAAALFYTLPTATGVLCQRWYGAVTLATLPAWFALGVFATVAAPRLGFAYLTQDGHAAGVIGTLELFAGLGLLGWIMRLATKDALSRRERSR
jgi:hypothetical protein